jgi:hypothetical protein
MKVRLEEHKVHFKVEFHDDEFAKFLLAKNNFNEINDEGEHDPKKAIVITDSNIIKDGVEIDLYVKEHLADDFRELVYGIGV